MRVGNERCCIGYKDGPQAWQLSLPVSASLPPLPLSATNPNLSLDIGTYQRFPGTHTIIMDITIEMQVTSNQKDKVFDSGRL